jgi:uncharacterized protein (DUF1330 family)
MAKGYWISRVDLTNPEAYRRYVECTVEVAVVEGVA